MQILLRECSDESIQWWVALGCAILQGRIESDLSQEISLGGVVRNEQSCRLSVLRELSSLELDLWRVDRIVGCGLESIGQSN